jgi:hypothetical protein
MRKMLICLGLFATLAACGAPPTLATQHAAMNQPVLPPASTSTIHLADGHIIACTAYPGAVCPRIVNDVPN